MRSVKLLRGGDHQAPHHGARAAHQLLPRLPTRRPIPWRSCAAWSARCPRSTTTQRTSTSPEQRLIASHRLIAKMPTIAAMAYKYALGQPFMYPRNDLAYPRKFPAHDLRRAVRGVRAEPGAQPRDGPHPDPARRPRAERLDLDRADSPVPRAPTRSPASPRGSPRCGAPRMAAPTRRCSRCCRRSAPRSAFREFIARAKDKNDPFRLMGFGHRVYKHYDPRGDDHARELP